LIDAGKLKKVMDQAGNAIEDFGVFGGWKNNIGNLEPNQGYKVNMLSPGTVTINASGSKQALIPPEFLASTHFSRVFTGNGTDHMNINFVDLSTSGFKVGDEIGIFDGNICVGAGQIGADQMQSNYIAIPASADDGLNQQSDGFTPGHKVIVRLFRNNEEYLVRPELLNNTTAIFAKGGSMFARINTQLATLISEISETSSVKCYPNPFTEQITVEISFAGTQKLDVDIYDAGGRLIRKLYQGNTTTKVILTWDGTNDGGRKVATGTYYLKANNLVKKLIYSRH
jgi:hypothetical protein